MSGSARVGTGAASGAASALVFTWVHQLLISDIWAMLVPMLVAGAGAGATIAWSHVALRPTYRLRSWLALNAAFLSLFLLLALWSLLVFEPVITFAELPTDAPPDELIATALPGTVVFTLVAAAMVTRLFGGGLRQLGVVLVTTVVLMLTLGLNVSVFGLVEFGTGEAGPAVRLLLLIVLLAAVHTALFALVPTLRPAPTTDAPDSEGDAG